MLNAESFLLVLRSVVAAEGNQQKAAKKFGVSGAYLSDVLHGRRSPAARLCAALGYRRVVMFEHVGPQKRKQASR